MNPYDFLLDLALILISTKIFGLITKRFQMPQVVGALLAGLIFGPIGFNLIKETDFIHKTSEIGVIVLMFAAGLETNIKDLKKTGTASAIIAIFGVVLPLLGGFAIASIFNTTPLSDASASIFLQNVFIGIILTATSVSITVETLKEMGKLSTRAGNAILGAAIIDDILGIIALTVITSFADASVNLWLTLLKIVAFFVISIVVGLLFFYFFEKYVSLYQKDMRRFIIVAFFFCLILSYYAEKLFGVADITGAFTAGLIISNSKKANYISSRFETLSYMYLSPIFFASIGLKVSLPHMTISLIVFSVLLLIVAILTKVVGCGLGAKLCRYSNREAVQVGCGMISRGEVALIVASKGSSLGLMSATYFGPIIVTVIITTVIAPILLKLSFLNRRNTTEVQITNALIEDYKDMDSYNQNK